MADLAGPEPTVARLARELDELRGLLRSYLVEREEAEDELRESAERCRALICRAAFGIYRATQDGRFIDANPALVRMLGYDDVAEVLRLDLGRDVFHSAADRELLVRRALEGETDTWSEARWRRKDGAVITVRLSVRVARDRRGGLAYLETVAEDITERLRREEVMRRSEHMASLGGLLAGVAHELNNPLASISGFAQILLRQAEPGQLTPEEARGAIETIDREARRAAKIVKDLLTFARRESSRERAPVDLGAIADYILSSQRYAIETRGIRRVRDLAEDLPPVLGDATQLEQVVLNLVVNAREALEQQMDRRSLPGAHQGPPRAPDADRRPELRVRTAHEGAHVVLEVADNGPGIAPADRARIWDPFWTTRGDRGGTGLGLSVVHSIVTEHGGTIHVESTPFEGTRFIVRLPAATGLATPTGGAAVGGLRANGHAAARPLDVLVLGVRAESLGASLAARGHATVTVPTLDEAIPLAEEGLFDVLVCEDAAASADVARRLEAVPACAAMRLVVFAGDEGALVRAVEAGGDAPVGAGGAGGAGRGA